MAVAEHGVDEVGSASCKADEGGVEGTAVDSPDSFVS